MKRTVILVITVIALTCLILLGLSLGTKAREKTPEQKEIQIISTSDVHGKLFPYNYGLNAPDASGSLSQLSTAFGELRNDNTVLVDLGDTIQGNSAQLFIHDPIHPMVHAQNLMGYDVWVPGNHEFNYGMDVLRDIIEQHDCNVLCSNVYNADGSPIADPVVILERDGVKIGIIGVVTPNIARWDAKNLEAAGARVTDPVEEIRAIVKEIRDDVDILIAACHMDCRNEFGQENSGVYDLADKVPELDIILASHGHKRIEEDYRNNVLITENRDEAKTLSLITVTLEQGDDGRYHVAGRHGKIYDMQDYEEDPKISGDKLLMEADARAKEDAIIVIARLTNEYLSPPDEIPGIPEAKIRDTALIRLINDVQRYYAGTEIAAVALHDDQANLYQGDIEKRDLALVYKFSNELCKVRMTGAQLVKWMEWSYNYINTFHEGDLNISFNPDIEAFNYDMFNGVNYEVDISRPAGSRISNVTLSDGTPLDMDGKYEVAVNDYRATSQLLVPGVIFTEEEGLPELVESGIRGDIGGIRELIADYIVNVRGVRSDDGTISFTAEDVNEQNANWKLTGYSWDEKKHERVAELIKAGKLSLIRSEDGAANNIRSITEADLAAAEAK